MARVPPARSSDIEPPVPTSRTIQDDLLDLIRRERLQAGDRLPSEAHLARQLRVSRSALREAMHSLEGAGYIESRSGSGWYVRSFSLDQLARAMTYTVPFDVQTLRDLAEIRTILETSLLEQAVASLRPEDLDKLEDAVDEMELLASKGGFCFAGPDRYFHRILFSRLNNNIVQGLLDVFWKLQMAIGAQFPENGDPVEEARKHRHILNAIRAGDLELARQRLGESLIAKVRRFLAAEQPAGRRD